MKVQFDLRPSGMLERERKQRSFNPTRTVAILLMLAFFLTSGGFEAAFGLAVRNLI